MLIIIIIIYIVNINWLKRNNSFITYFVVACRYTILNLYGLKKGLKPFFCYNLKRLKVKQLNFLGIKISEYLIFFIPTHSFLFLQKYRFQIFNP